MHLLPHPSTGPGPVRALEAVASYAGAGTLRLHYRLDADLAMLRIPSAAQSERRDELWRQTCFEAFVATSGSGDYAELNFSPCGAWAAYGFTSYRGDVTPLALARPPATRWRRERESLSLDVNVIIAGFQPAAGALRVALAAIIEDKSGIMSYWALRHPPGKPDFHHASGFALELSIPGVPPGKENQTL
jgi:hypothetical protein